MTEHFDIKELVSKQVYSKYGSTAWSFFDPRLFETIEFIRKLIDTPMIVNDWHNSGRFQQRGFRANKDLIVLEKKGLYCSAHCTGQAIDFHTRRFNAEQVRQIIIGSQDRLPCNIRMEKGVNWVHVDVRGHENKKIHLFKV